MHKRNKSERRNELKTFYGGIFIEKEKLEREGINYPIKLEYYKKVNDEKAIKEGQKRYGVNIVRTDYQNDKPRIEEGSIEFLTNDEEKVEQVLKIFKEFEVTPIDMPNVMDVIYRKLF